MKRRSRLIAACTTGVLSFGALALGPAATAAYADDAPHRTVHQVAPPATPKPSLHIPRDGKASHTATPPALRYDVDGDGYNDQLLRGGNDHYYNLLANSTVDLGTGPSGVVYKDVLTPGDLDGQPGPEILALTASGQLSEFSANQFPNGTATWSSNGWQVYNKLIVTGDITGDGKPDLLARTTGGALYLYPGTGQGSAPFGDRVLVGGGWNAFDQLVGAGDVTGDGINDLIVSEPSGDLYLYKGTGNASDLFASRVKIGSGWNIYAEVIGTGDLGKDGLGDLLAITPNGDMYFYRGDATAVLGPSSYVGPNWNSDLFSGQGSNPHYGKHGVYALGTDGTLYWYGSRDNGAFGDRAQVSDNGGFAGSQLTNASALGDYDHGDLLERYQGNLYSYSDSAPSPTTPIATGWGSYNLLVGPGDLTGDGKGDLLARDTAGHMYLYPGRGTGTGFYNRVDLGAGWNAYNKIVGAGDFSGDGITDIVARAGDGTLYLYKGTGNGFRPFADRVNLGRGWSGYKLSSPGDLDGDGLADLLAIDGTGTLWRYSGSSQGGFKQRAKLGGGWNAYSELL